MVQVAWCEFGKFAGQGNRGHMRGLEEGVVVGQLVHLARGNLAHFRPAIAEVHTPQAGHGIQDLIAVAVRQIDAAGPRNDPRAFCSQFVIGCERVHVMRCVQRLKLGSWQMIGDG